MNPTVLPVLSTNMVYNGPTEIADVCKERNKSRANGQYKRVETRCGGDGYRTVRRVRCVRVRSPTFVERSVRVPTV